MVVLPFQIKQKFRPALQNNDFGELVDPRLMNQYNDAELRMMMAYATACTCYSPHERPRISPVRSIISKYLQSINLASNKICNWFVFLKNKKKQSIKDSYRNSVVSSSLLL